MIYYYYTTTTTTTTTTITTNNNNNNNIIIIVITRQVLGRPVCDRGAIPENEKLYANYFAAFQL